MGRSQKIRATGELIGDAFAGAVDTVAAVHQAIARRTFAALGPAATPVRVLHDAITSGVYRVVRGAHALPRAISVVAAAGAGLFDHVPPAASRPAGFAIALLNGWVGEDLGRRHPALALGMTLHSESAEVTATPDGFAAAFPFATSRIVVFVHGLVRDRAVLVVVLAPALRHRAQYPRLAPGTRSRLHGHVPALQQRLAHLRQRGAAGAAARGVGRRLAGGRDGSGV